MFFSERLKKLLILLSDAFKQRVLEKNALSWSSFCGQMRCCQAICHCH